MVGAGAGAGVQAAMTAASANAVRSGASARRMWNVRGMAGMVFLSVALLLGTRFKVGGRCWVRSAFADYASAVF